MASYTSVPVGKVLIIHGTVKAVSASGVERILGPNSVIYANEHIVTGPDGSVSIGFNDNPAQLTLGRMTDVAIDDDVYSAAMPDHQGAGALSVEDIQAALVDNENFDPTTDLPAPAAGPGAGGGVTPAGGDRHIVIFEPDQMQITPDSGAETRGITFNFLDEQTYGLNPESADGTDTTAVTPNPPIPPGGGGTETPTDGGTETPGGGGTTSPAAATVTLSDISATEGSGMATVVATIDQAVTGTPLVLTLTNGAIITIPVGATTGTSNGFIIPGDDPYVDGQVYAIGIEGTSGGNFTQVESSGTANVTVVDTIDPTNVSLTVGPDSISENGNHTVTYTVTLDNPVRDGDAPVTVTLSNGQTVTITSGSSGSVDYTFTGTDDVYIDPDSSSVTITGATQTGTGGAFESIVINPTPAVVQITDDNDPTTASLTVGPDSISEDGNHTVTYTVTLDNPVRDG
ncbi:MAG: retention module-containing protein, partial [Desulfopila sp.]